MERERPEYLPPIERRRWNFPWLITGFLTLVSLTTIGVLTLGRTNSAWSERFEGVRRSIEATEQSSTARPERSTAVSSTPSTPPERLQAQPPQKAQGLRCINGMFFRRIEGGWENLPGSRCGDLRPVLCSALLESHTDRWMLMGAGSFRREIVTRDASR
jgi:hypothetical protein